MATETLTIGQEVEIYSYYTKQRGYGRQSLYVELKRTDIPFDLKKSFIKDVYVMDVFPNVLEHYQHAYYISEYAHYDEERGVYTRDSGDGEYTEDCIFGSINELLNHALEGKEFEFETEEEEVEND